MSIINNDRAGSQIRLLCLIDRVLNRRKQKLIERDELIAMLRPSNLPKKTRGESRFAENLDFWVKEGLWHQEGSAISRAEISASEVDLPCRVLDLLINNAKERDLMQGNRGEPFLRSVTALLAQEKYTFVGRTCLDKGNISKAVGRLSTDRAFNETNEAATLLEYAEFLGFLEPFGSGYIVDPTRAIEPVLSDVFQDKGELTANQFMANLVEIMPMLDGGSYRQLIEPLLTAQDWQPLPYHQVSASLSHALIRLELDLKLTLESRSDDLDALQLQTPDGKQRQISVIRLREND
ncbi:protein DpdG [Corallincola platygyrae]|uniref:Protein DpdG n=1 Tax=Corallincola platygyrae TaxID=1193278 RepID=A0ABW4XHG4_9GAMM